MRIAAKEGVKWILTPELALTGYRFEPVIGLDWISHEGYLQRLQAVAAELKVNLFLSHLEQDLKTKKYFNTLFVISSSGKVIGKHHKINTIPISESWSQAGTETNLINVEGYQVGLLICADAWPDKHALALKQKGAELLISSANWAPGKHGPKDSWQKRSLETNLPLFVCNRTGIENTLDMRKAESVVVSSGEKLATHYSDESSILLIRWDMEEKSLLNQKTIPIDC